MPAHIVLWNEAKRIHFRSECKVDSPNTDLVVCKAESLVFTPCLATSTTPSDPVSGHENSP